MYAEPFYNHNLTSSAQTEHIIHYIGGAECVKTECNTDAAFQKTCTNTICLQGFFVVVFSAATACNSDY